MSTTKRPYLLKVFSGPHVGAEIQLEEGEHFIGSGEDCDIILHDQLLSAKHVRVTVEGAKVSIEPVNQSVILLNGVQISGKTVLELFQYFTIGTTHLAVGPSDQAWPHRDFPDFQLQHPKEDAQSPPKDEAATPQATPVVTSSAVASPSEKKQLSEADSANDVPHSHRFLHVLRGPYALWGVVAAILILICGMGTITVLAEGNRENTSEAPTITKEKIEAIITEVAPDASVTVENVNGGFAVQGWVKTEQVKSELRASLMKLSSKLRLDITDSQSLTESVESSIEMYNRLDNFDLELKTSAGEPGEVVVTGEVAQLSEWLKMRRSIINDLPKLKKLDDQGVVTGEIVEPETAQEEVQIASRTPIEVSVPNLPKKEVSRTEESENVLNDLENLPIRGWSIGQQSMVSLENGDIIFEGGLLADGYILESIQPDHLVLSRNGKELIMNAE